MAASEADSLTQHTLGLIKAANKSGGLFFQPSVDYFEFSQRWLPLFNAAAHEGGLAPLGEWVQEVCRGIPFTRVHVIKGGSKVYDNLYNTYVIEGGELMFTVPPILNREVDIKLKSGKDLDVVATESRAISQRMAVAGDRHFRKNLIDGIEISNVASQNLCESMNKIFEHYGLKRVLQKDLLDKTKDTKSPKHIERKETEILDNSDINFDF